MTKRYLLVADFKDSQSLEVAMKFEKFNPAPLERSAIVLRSPGSDDDIKQALEDAVSDGLLTHYALIEMPKRSSVTYYRLPGVYASAFDGWV
ncbi:MAG: hypothetical protein H7Y60_09660 [Rhodospirillaceae bacterium]|nr:hypothetical protein [Rhodospirillales bacterium]